MKRSILLLALIFVTANLLSQNCLISTSGRGVSLEADSTAAVNLEAKKSVILPVNEKMELLAKKSALRKYHNLNGGSFSNIHEPAISFGSDTVPSFSWAKTIGGKAGAVVREISIDSSENIYIVGSFSNTIEIGGKSITPNGLWNMFIAKYDKNGNTIWVKSASCADYGTILGYGIGLDSTGNVYVTGYFNALYAKFGDVCSISDSTGETYLFVAKYSNEGNIQWAKSYKINAPNAWYSIETDASGNSYIIGRCDGKGLMLGYDRNGNMLWEKLIEGIYFTNITLHNSKLYVAGTLFSSVSVDSINVTISGNKPFIAMADTNGTFNWMVSGNDNSSLGNGDIGQGYDVTFDSQNNIYFSGDLGVSLIFCSDTLVCPIFGQNFLVKLDSDGHCIWARNGIGDAFKGNLIFIDSNDYPYLVGRYSNGLNFGSSSYTGEGVFMEKFDKDGTPLSADTLDHWPGDIVLSHSGNQVRAGYTDNEIFVSSFKPDGSQLWSKTTKCLSGNTDVWYLHDMDKQGNIYMQGGCFGTFIYNGGNVSDSGVYIAKMGSDGTEKWIKFLSSSGVSSSSIAAGSDGNIYAWGSFANDLRIGTAVNFNDSGNWVYVVKFDSAGNFKWFRNFGSTCRINPVGGIALDNENNIIIIGNSCGDLSVEDKFFPAKSNSAQDIFVLKYDNSGNLKWAKMYGSASINWGRSAVCDKSDNIFITGGFIDTLRFGNALIVSKPKSDIFIAKLLPDGTEQWIKQAGGYGSDRAFNIALDPSENIFISGWLNSSNASFGNIQIQNNSYPNIFLAKYTPEGIATWVRVLVATNSAVWPFYKIGTDNQGNCYIGGSAYGTLTLNNSPLLNDSNLNNFVASFSPDGNLRWIKSFGSSQPAGIASQAFCLSVYAEDNLTVSGRMNADAELFDNYEIGASNCNAFVAMIGNFKLNTVIASELIKNRINLFPNPSSGLFNFKVDDPIGGDVELEVFNIQGMQICSFKFIKSPAETVHTIDLSSLPKGVYLFKVTTGIKSTYQKAVLR